MYSSPAHSRHGSLPGSPQPVDRSQSDPNIRWMPVKILYTFDDSKTNCLARCPQPLQVQTAQLDQHTQIGIVELRTCIRAIVTASPELVARLGQDYTVYAYDYSEYETPLVGQGMLSWVLASSSSTPNAPAHESQTMVTGRVTRNAFGLFSSGPLNETLEVKLKLVPVPTSMQKEYLQSLEKYRDPRLVPADAIDTAAWTNFLRENPAFGASATSPSNSVACSAFDTHPTYQGSPDAFSPMTDGPQPMNLDSDASMSFSYRNGYGSDAGSPFSNPISVSAPQPAPPVSRPLPRTERAQSQSHSRPSSRASVRATKPPLKSSQSCISRIETDQNEESGPARKRARVEQVDWNSKSSFGQKSDSLRVAASTAASIRGQRPPPSIHPTASQIAAGELPERPPTPRAAPRIRNLIARRGSDTAVTSKSRFYQSPYTSQTGSEADASRSETPGRANGSVTSSPQEMPSSPPIACTSPTSPELPMPKDVPDSGFFSGAADDDFVLDLMGQDDMMLTTDRPVTANTNPNGQTDTTYQSFSVPEPPQSRTRGTKRTRKDASQVELPMPSSPISQLFTSPTKEFDPFPAQPENAADPTHDLQQISNFLGITQSELNDQDDSQAVDATADLFGEDDAGVSNLVAELESGSKEDGETSMATKMLNITKSVTSGPGEKNSQNEKKKRAIQQRLAAAIRNGQWPAFCQNCGEIETPTWRKAFTKVVQGPLGDTSTTEDEGGVTAIQVTRTDDNASVLEYRVFKKSLARGENKEKDGYEEMNLCNPCGIWLIKKKAMRPPPVEKDAADPPTRKRDRKAEYARRKAQREAQMQAQLAAATDAIDGETSSQPPSGRSDKSVAKFSGRAGNGARTRVTSRRTSTAAPAAPHSDGHMLLETNAERALQRAIQSSPPRFPGSKHSPIHVEDDEAHDPVKRTLFPSPRRAPGEPLLLGPSSKPSPPSQASPSGPSLEDFLAPQNKENHTPADADFLAPPDFLTSPRRSPRKTNSPYKRMDDIAALLKTPTKNPAESSTSRASSSTAKRWAEDRGAARPLEPQTPTRDRRTPKMQQQAANNVVAAPPLTPFSRQLAQLIQDAESQMASSPSALFGSPGTKSLFGAEFQWDSHMSFLNDINDWPQPDGDDATTSGHE